MAAPIPPRYDVSQSPEFIAGRERGTEWAKAQVTAEGAVAKETLSADRIHEALGSDRGERGHGFLRGVRDVIMSLHPYERPNVIIEVARVSSPSGAPPPKQGLWARFRSATSGVED